MPSLWGFGQAGFLARCFSSTPVDLRKPRVTSVGAALVSFPSLPLRRGNWMNFYAGAIPSNRSGRGTSSLYGQRVTTWHHLLASPPGTSDQRTRSSRHWVRLFPYRTLWSGLYCTVHPEADDFGSLVILPEPMLGKEATPPGSLAIRLSQGPSESFLHALHFLSLSWKCHFWTSYSYTAAFCCTNYKNPCVIAAVLVLLRLWPSSADSICPSSRPLTRNVSQFEQPEKCVFLLSVGMFSLLDIMIPLTQNFPLCFGHWATQSQICCPFPTTRTVL